MKKASSRLSIVSIENMDEDLEVTTEMAVRLGDAVLSGELPAADLHTIGFALQASEKFHWDGDEDKVLADSQTGRLEATLLPQEGARSFDS